MENQITNEQKAHDLAIAYSTYIATTSDSPVDVGPFYEEYERAYDVFLRLAK